MVAVMRRQRARMRRALQPETTILFNKPYGVLSTFTGTAGLGHRTLREFITVPHVYAAGRLDADSEGLLLLTSDGALAHRLTDPVQKVPKMYVVQVEGTPTRDQLHRLECGVMVRGKRTRPALVELLKSEPRLWPRAVPIRFRKSVPTSWLCITIREGMNRQIRRMTAAVGCPTLRLVRVQIGPLNVNGLEPGQWRSVAKHELASLYRSGNNDRQ